MLKNIVAKTSLFSIPLLFVLLTGCARSPQPNFYMLTSQTQPVLTNQALNEKLGIRVAVGVSIPAYLDRPQILLRHDNNVSVQSVDSDQWGEPLADGVTRILCDQLSASLTQGIAFPLRSTFPANWRLTVEILRLDGALGNEAILEALWTLAPENDTPEHIVASGRFADHINVGSTFADLAQAESTLLSRFGEQLASIVKTQTRKK